MHSACRKSRPKKRRRVPRRSSRRTNMPRRFRCGSWRRRAKSYQLLGEMAANGNPASISDVGVGLLASRACIEGAAMNVRINLGSLKDEKVKTALRERLQKISDGIRVRISKNRSDRPKQVGLSRAVKTLAVLHASQLVTLAGPKRARIGAELGELSIIPDGGMLVRDGTIIATGPIGRDRKADAERRGSGRCRRPRGSAWVRRCAYASCLWRQSRG